MSDQIPLARSSTITNIVSLNSQLFSPPNTQLIFYRTNSIDTVVFPSPDSFCGQWFINNSYPINLLPSILVVPSSVIPTVYLSSSIILGLFIEPDNSYPSVLNRCFLLIIILCSDPQHSIHSSIFQLKLLRPPQPILTINSSI